MDQGRVLAFGQTGGTRGPRSGRPRVPRSVRSRPSLCRRRRTPRKWDRRRRPASSSRWIRKRGTWRFTMSLREHSGPSSTRRCRKSTTSRKRPGSPKIDRVAKTITIYSVASHTLLTFGGFRRTPGHAGGYLAFRRRGSLLLQRPATGFAYDEREQSRPLEGVEVNIHYR